MADICHAVYKYIGNINVSSLVCFSSLGKRKMTFPITSSNCSVATLLIPKPGTDLHFTVNFCLVDKFTILHQIPISNIQNEPTKLYTVTVQVTFDISPGYWQLPLSLDY